MTHLPLFPDTYAHTDPDRPAYVMASSGLTVTYGELVATSRAVAGLLHQRGLRHGDTVAVLMENNEYYFPVVWAFQRAGLRYVALSTRLSSDDVAYILRDARVQTLITSPHHLETAHAAAEAAGVPHLFTTGADVDGAVALTTAIGGVEPHPDEAEGADLLYSSGTTGRPKGVVADLPSAPLGSPPGFTTLFHERWGLDADSVYLSPAPLYHAAPLRVGMSVHRYGGLVVVMESFDAQSALDLIAEHRVTVAQMVPTMLLRMLKLPLERRRAADLSSLRCLVHAAAPMPQAAKRQLIDWVGPIVREFYSATENYLFTELDSDEWLAHPGSVGKPLVGAVHILDGDGGPVAPGTVGEIWSAGGPSFAYLNDAAKTAQAHNDRGWATVGDLGYLDADGYLYLSERRSDLILSGGVNIYPQEAENLLLVHPDVADAAVFGVDHDELGQVVHGAVQLSPGVAADAATQERLLRHLTDQLSGYKCPRALDFVSRLPRLPTGKLLRRELMEQHRQVADDRQ
ncbi:AMP-binding protein [Gordonia alkaliphila]|uniref:AMP-binding protein n=1 Tax=Gordonia alkaliphila TaxID=1053547 RepID=UPI001FF34014|nr:AMP-binding protein [Gordonia alkaliphila]MCK0439425.1 AMP-binding protein [Gordonia alkaliphila]